jgi:hypothetical protein
MFHSVARAIQGAQVEDVPVNGDFVTIIDPVPQGHSRYFMPSQAVKSSFAHTMGGQIPSLRLSAAGGAGIVELFILSEGTRYQIHTESGITLGSSPVQNATVLLAPGESVIARVGAGNLATSIRSYAFFLDIQGPFEHQRVPITAAFATVIPAPAFGKVHTPIGLPGEDININSYLVRQGQAGGDVNEEARLGGVVVDATSTVSPAPNSMTDTMLGLSTGVFNATVFSGVVPFGQGMDLRARLDAAGTGIVAFASYLVTDDPNA